jgi:hypothetical protein
MNERERQYQPDYGIEGPAPTSTLTARRVVLAIVSIAAAAFIAGAIGRHFGVL